MKRKMSLVLSGLLSLSCTAGCGPAEVKSTQGNTTEVGQTESPAATESAVAKEETKEPVNIKV